MILYQAELRGSGLHKRLWLTQAQGGLTGFGFAKNLHALLDAGLAQKVPAIFCKKPEKINSGLNMGEYRL